MSKKTNKLSCLFLSSITISLAWQSYAELPEAVAITIEGHNSEVNSATFSPDGSRIVTASRDNTAKIWDAETGDLIHTLEGHNDWVKSATYSPDGSRIVTASMDRTAKIWTLKPQKPYSLQTVIIMSWLKSYYQSLDENEEPSLDGFLSYEIEDKTLQDHFVVYGTVFLNVLAKNYALSSYFITLLNMDNEDIERLLQSILDQQN